MSLNIGELVQTMLGAAKGELEAAWPKAKDFAEAEFKKLAERSIEIGKQRVAGNLSSDEAEDLLLMQKRAAETVFLAIQGLTLVAIQNAINAALNAIKDAVNTAVGIVVL